MVKPDILCPTCTGVAERVAAAVGARLLDAAPGPLTAVCDARTAHDADALTDRARRIVGLHAGHGFHGRVVVALPATWSGIRAAEQLEREGIRTDLTYVFSIAQARHCFLIRRRGRPSSPSRFHRRCSRWCESERHNVAWK